jgi:hypothetical protein
MKKNVINIRPVRRNSDIWGVDEWRARDAQVAADDPPGIARFRGIYSAIRARIGSPDADTIKATCKSCGRRLTRPEEIGLIDGRQFVSRTTARVFLEVHCARCVTSWENPTDEADRAL